MTIQHNVYCDKCPESFIATMVEDDGTLAIKCMSCKEVKKIPTKKHKGRKSISFSRNKSK